MSTQMASIKRTFKQEIRKAHLTYIASLTDKNGTITKQFWSYIKKQWKDNFGVASLKQDNNTYNDSQTKAQLLNYYFTSVFIYYSSETLPWLSFTWYHNPQVFNLLNELDISEAPGPDKIPVNFLKMCCTEIAPILTLIYQASIQQSTVPSDWKQVNIVPIFKKREQILCNNYRHVSLICICCKILEHIIYSHIFHLSQHNVLCNERHGFCHSRSCETQLLLTVNDFAESLNNNGQIYARLF